MNKMMVNKGTPDNPNWTEVRLDEGTGAKSHIEGEATDASGAAAHAEGNATVSSGDASHAQNDHTVAQGYAQTALGQYNKPQGTKATRLATDQVLIVGNGTSDANRTNAMEVTWKGDLKMSGEIADGNGNTVSGIADRLNTETSESIVLPSGISAISSKKNTLLDFADAKGKARHNIIGKLGSGETTYAWEVNANATLNLNSDNVLPGRFNSLKVASTNTNVESIVEVKWFPIISNAYYVALGRIKTEVGTAYIRPVTFSDSNSEVTYDYGAEVPRLTPTGKFSLFKFKFQATAKTTRLMFRCQVGSTDKSIAYFSDMRVFQVTKEEYDAFSALSESETEESFPYTDGIQPVRNPYVVRYGKNLAPAFSDWSPEKSSMLTKNSAFSQDDATFTIPAQADSTSIVYHAVVPVVTGKTYTFALDHNGSIAVNTLDAYEQIVPVSDASYGTINGWTTEQKITFTVPTGVNLIRLAVSNVGALTSSHTFTNPRLNVGSSSMNYEPRKESIMAWNTDLYADPATGNYADTIIQTKDGYYKKTVWRKLVLDGSLPWYVIFSNNNDAWKTVAIPVSKLSEKDSGYVTKYDGRNVTRFNMGESIKGGDYHVLSDSTESNNPNILALTVYNADSGWAASYTPSVQEIKAYFAGWKMYDSGTNTDGGGMYARTDGVNKAWAQRREQDGVYFGGTVTLPNNVAVENFTPYELVYRIQTPVLEPVETVGRIALREGDNTLEVNSGIVIRERIKPVTVDGSYYHINNKANSSLMGSKVTHRTDRIVGVYENGVKVKMAILKSEYNAFGRRDLHITSEFYKSSAEYTMTYTTQRKSPKTSIKITYSTNEKSQIVSLIDSVEKVDSRLSSLERRVDGSHPYTKIYPTLINGWTSYDTPSSIASGAGHDTAYYYKDSDNMVYLGGLIKNGVQSSSAFILASGYRPKNYVSLPTYYSYTANNTNYETACRVLVAPDGNVVIASPINVVNQWVTLSVPPFKADL